MTREVLKLTVPVVAGLGGSLYSYFLRGHPWEAALVVGLAIGTLTYAGLRSRERLRRVYREARSPWRRDD